MNPLDDYTLDTFDALMDLSEQASNVGMGGIAIAAVELAFRLVRQEMNR